MNKKSKILLSSIATIAMCASVATGATYALFTSESEVSIAVTSGTVDVRATASELSLYTDGEAQNGAFALGGTATKNGNIIKIERMMPMDSVNFDIVIENYSDVTVQYRTVINSVSDTGLFSALEVTFTEGETEQVFKGGYSYADWATLEPEDTDKDTAEAVKTINVNIEFPDGANQNGHQGKSCEIAVTVEAVQGNADVVNPVTKVADNNYLVNSEEGMMLISGLMKDFAPNEAKMFNLALTADMDMKGYDWASPNFYFTNFNGNGHTISNLNCVSNDSYAGQVGFAGYFGGGSLKNVTFENVTATGNQAGVIAGAFDGCEEISGVVIKGRNTVSYKNVNENEKASGVGAIFGVNGMYGIKTYTQASIVVDSGAMIDVYYNDMQTQILKYYDFADKYAFASTNLNEALTDNGTVTAHGVWYQIISDGFMRSSEGEYVITNKAGLYYFAQTVNNNTAPEHIVYTGKTVLLETDITFEEGEVWTPIGNLATYPGISFHGVFDGQNHTITNMHAVDTYPNFATSALFGSVCSWDNTPAAVKNITLVNPTVESTKNAAGIVGYVSVNPIGGTAAAAVTIDNCHVVGGTITSTAEVLANGSYDNGDKVGGIVGILNQDNGSIVTNCSVKGTTICAYRDIGGIAGYADGMLKNNVVEDVTIVVDTEHNYKNYDTIDKHDANAIVGEQGDDAVLENNTESGVEYVYEYAVKTQDALSSAMTDGANVSITLDAGEYTIPSNVQNSNIVIKGTTDTVVNMSNGTYLDKSNIAFEGVTIKLGLGYVNGGTGSDYTALYSKNATFTNCTFEGGLRVGRDGAQFINCTFNLNAGDYVYTYGNDNLLFDGCTFNSKGKALIIYSDGNGTGEATNVIVKNCTFNASQGGTAYQITNQNCAAIEIDNYGCGVNLTLEKNTVNNIGENGFSGVWRIKSYDATKAANGNSITINGVAYTSLALDGKTMTVSNRVVTIVD